MTTTIAPQAAPTITARHIQAGQPAEIPRGHQQQAALRDMRARDYPSLSEEQRAEVAEFNNKRHDTWHADATQLKSHLGSMVADPETIDFVALWGYREVAGQQVLELDQRRVVIMRERVDLAKQVVEWLEATQQKRDKDLPKVLKSVGAKLTKAGMGVESTQAGRAGNYHEAAERQFAYQCRQHPDYLSAEAAAKQAKNDLKNAQRFVRVAEESVDLAVEALHQFVASMLVGTSVDL